jgi:Zn-dependent peptidase ImmA (M78 family)
LEEWLYSIYKKNRIYYPEDMDIHNIAEIFSTYLHFHNGIPITDQREGDIPIILLDARKREAEKRKDFFHELGHVIKHVGDQETMPKSFSKLQEVQAEQFALYASIPVYMLGDILRDVYSYASFGKNIAEQFKLPMEHVEKRLLQINNRIFLKYQDIRFIRRQASIVVTDESFKLFLEENKRKSRELFGDIYGKTFNIL